MSAHSPHHPPFSSPRIGIEAPDFTARTTHGDLLFSSLRGHWVLFFSHPADFTPVCTSEFIALARMEKDFREKNCALLGLSIDSLSSHLAWIDSIEQQFGVQVPFPLIEDPSMEVARAYGMIHSDDQSSATIRAVFFIDPNGIIQAIMTYPASIGRSVTELFRTLCALQEAATTNVLTPEGWQPGTPTLTRPAQTQEDVRKAGPTWFFQAGETNS